METVDTLNRRLKDYFGSYLDGQPNYRIVWSEEQLEKRLCEYSSTGFQLIIPEVREVPKYSHYIHDKFVLERLIEVPYFDQETLVSPLSYEPIWVFEDTLGNQIFPKWEAIQVILGSVHEAAAKAVGVKYKDPALDEQDPKIGLEVREARLKGIEEALFGNETVMGDALAYREGIVVPAPMQKEGSE